MNLNRPHFRRSLATRVAVLTTMAVGFTVSLVAVSAYIVVRMQSMQSLDDSMRERATAAVETHILDPQTSRSIPLWMLGATDTRIAFLDISGARVYTADESTARVIARPELRVAAGRVRFSARSARIEGQLFRMVAVPTDKPGTALVLAQSLEPTSRMLDRLGLVALLFGVAGMVIAGLAGWGVARNGLRPVRRLTAKAEEIARTGELDPIPVEGNDEVARLSAAFNAMLASLAAARHRQRQLVADAGHELRTPLTSLRTNLDLLVQADVAEHPLDRQARGELLDDVRAQIGEMTTLIGDLVELARDDPETAATQQVDLADIVTAATARVRRRAPDLQFDVRTEPWWVIGDPTALERAVTNLLDNAAKWSPDGGTVRAHLEEGTLVVCDEGPGIAPADLPLIFERFYRSRAARSMPGSGLGLSIVKTVAERFGGAVRAGTGPDGGAAFWLSIPGTGQAPPED